ncbi:hypothetical protein [Hyphomicrobium facile]|uniref:HNH endonuclease n=1 Tax=Hyphomicrobium facile TaxID=51670 RepID=A0A1I7MV88_9HYPH|nr:hypothetical protein [Hyphomicrobium facile]SFV26307.1 hypothetical protein SAMN04488557_0417 [Hyphomicrobium facile]
MTLDEFKRLNPYCCYCGGRSPTQQEEHAPPKILFFEKRRPDQLVVPACGKCNGAFAQTDQIVAFLARATREWSGVGLDRERIAKMMQFGIAKRHPELIQEWSRVTLSQRRRLRRITGCDFSKAPALNFGPLTLRHFQAFGARMAFAMHYHHTKRIIPERGGAIVEIKTAQHLLAGWRPPAELFEVLGNPRTLAQGKRNHVANQFLFACGPDAATTCYFAAFGADFALILFVSEDDGEFEAASALGAHIHKPGKFFEFPLPLSMGPLCFEAPLIANGWRFLSALRS